MDTHATNQVKPTTELPYPVHISLAPPPVITLKALVDAYLQEYELRQFRIDIAKGRAAHLRAYFGDDRPAAEITAHAVRQYQVARRQQGAARGTVNRETSGLSRMFRIAVQWGWLSSSPVFPARLRENPPKQGFFEHREYLAVRKHLPAPR